MNTATVPSRILSPEQIETFHREGRLVARGVIDDATIAPVRQELTTWIDAQARQLKADGKITNAYADEPFGRRMGLILQQYPAIHDTFDTMFLRGIELFKLMLAPRLIAASADLLGPEVSLHPVQHIRIKPPYSMTPEHLRAYFAVTWHQDSGVLMEEADQSEIITAWLPLVDVTEEMGVLQAIPNSHRNGHLDHVNMPYEGTTNEYRATIRPSLMPKLPVDKMAVSVGDVIFMHRNCPHHSGPNRSDRCRWSLDLRYQRTGDHSGRPWQPVLPVVSDKDPASALTRDAAGHRIWADSWIKTIAEPNGLRTQYRIAPNT